MKKKLSKTFCTKKSFFERHDNVKRHYRKSFTQEIEIKWKWKRTRKNVKYIKRRRHYIDHVHIDNVWKLIDKNKSRRVVDNTKHTKIIREIVMFQRNEFRILQYNVHKSRNKVIMTLLNEIKIKNYDILMIQKLWRFNKSFKTYCSTSVDFTLTNNENKIYFYINKRIDNNNWHFTWHFKKINIITLQIHANEAQTIFESIHIHEMYNSSFKNHETIYDKRNLSMIKRTLHMSKESILIKNFNLHHALWEESSYSKQHRLINELIDMTIVANVSLTLSKNTITKNYQKLQTTIDLTFTFDDITNKLFRCEIDNEMKNFSNHLSIQTIIDLIVQKKSTRQSRKNWKTTNEKKFINTLKKQISKSLSNQVTRRQRINEYTRQLFKTLKQAIEIFTSWIKSHEMIKI